MISDMRAFIAIELAAEVKTELARVQMLLRRDTACPAKWVAPENIHLTLCFLGNLTKAQVGAVKGAMDDTGKHFAPLQLTTSLPGAFPSAERPQTVWVGLEGDHGVMSRLHRYVEESLHVVGYRPDARPFRPHLTIARVHNDATQAVRLELGAAIQRLKIPSLRIDVSGLSLMKSVLNPAGAIYSCLCRVELTGMTTPRA